ncbi:hypothetical protein GCM10023184_45810 [Flaviaesturariibacter amylovorans]|uniref:Uncharacterized protein n=1 Tax=Flaviaesturariibacter amylovorans TaxID=1084520 RepID=A0ABP8HU34_9BACT
MRAGATRPTVQARQRGAPEHDAAAQEAASAPSSFCEIIQPEQLRCFRLRRMH